MRSRILISILPLRALVVGAAVLFALSSPAAELAPQTSKVGGVEMSVKPKEVSAGAKTWVFEVALNTHSVDLNDDFPAAATLVDAKGKPQPAVAWEGDPAGGHHRKGVLRFNAPSPQPQALELRIQRPGEAAARTFRWKLK